MTPKQLDCFAPSAEHPPFGGATYDGPRDEARLAAQMGKVRAVMADGAWRTLAEIAEAVGSPEASVSARLRDLRKPAFGGHTVERQYVERALFRYRVSR